MIQYNTKDNNTIYIYVYKLQLKYTIYCHHIGLKEMSDKIEI